MGRGQAGQGSREAKDNEMDMFNGSSNIDWTGLMTASCLVSPYPGRDRGTIVYISTVPPGEDILQWVWL